jgi:hypothetical protein
MRAGINKEFNSTANSFTLTENFFGCNRGDFLDLLFSHNFDPLFGSSS